MSIEIFNFTTFLDESEIKFLKANIVPVSLGAETILFYQDDVCKDILLLEEGEVSLYIYGDENDEMISLYTIGAGEQCIINTASAISSTPVIANAVTKSPIKGYMMPATITKKLMGLNDEYQNFIFSLFSLKFNSLTTLIEDIKFKKLDARILALPVGKNETMITITHEQIATNLNTSRVVVSRVLKDLENKNKIKLHRGKIEVL
jgi:CRP/FNR family transcriptional regulator